MNFKSISLIAVFASLITIPVQVMGQAKPKPPWNLEYSPNAESFTWYLNNKVTWKDGKTRVFQNLGDCVQPWDNPTKNASFRCYRGYVKIIDPLGSKLCELQGYNLGGYIRDYVIWHQSNGSIGTGRPYPCREL